MSKNMLIDAAHMEEIRVAVVDGEKLEKFDFEILSKSQTKGNIYLAKIVRVEPSLQAAFIDYGSGKHGFLSFSEIHPNYFQIPTNDREELESHIQNAMAVQASENGETEDDIDLKEISKLRYQFYKRYKIQEVIKKKQIMLVQITKEERGNKGAALTTYISLAGRYCVLMPNTSKNNGVSRKINNQSDRKKLKSIISSLHIENGSAVIRTAGIGHTKAEIKKDFDYLVNLWSEIRETTVKSIAPCLIHEEDRIIKRAIRDMYSRDVESIFVDGESGFQVAKAFMRKLSPSQVKKVKLYEKSSAPLFTKFKINDQINQIYSTRVDLPSGGYLIINTTEALISIDVNSGKSIRERNIGGTALKTNMEAAVEIARQCRLRDLAGLIVIDFIDMEEKRNNTLVERCLRDALRSDKAKVQVGNISGFGLLELSRQRLRSSIADANMITCHHCSGTGFIWSDESLAIQVLRKIEETCTSLNLKEMQVTLSPSIAMYIMNNKRTFISHIESKINAKIIFNIDNNIPISDFKIEPIIGNSYVLNEEKISTSLAQSQEDSTTEQSTDITENAIESEAPPSSKSRRRNALRSRNRKRRKMEAENSQNEEASSAQQEIFVVAEPQTDTILQNVEEKTSIVEDHTEQKSSAPESAMSKMVGHYQDNLNPSIKAKIQKNKRGWWQKILKNTEEK